MASPLHSCSTFAPARPRSGKGQVKGMPTESDVIGQLVFGTQLGSCCHHPSVWGWGVGWQGGMFLSSPPWCQSVTWMPATRTDDDNPALCPVVYSGLLGQESGRGKEQLMMKSRPRCMNSFFMCVCVVWECSETLFHGGDFHFLKMNFTLTHLLFVLCT